MNTLLRSRKKFNNKAAACGALEGKMGQKNKLFKDVKVASNGKHVVEAIYDNAGLRLQRKKEKNLFHKAAPTLIVLLKLNLVSLWENKSNQTSKMLSSTEHGRKTIR